MNNVVKIQNQEVIVKDYKGHRVVTFKDIDSVHERAEGTARKRFNDNKRHMIEGEDFFKVKCSEVRPFFGQTLPNGFNPRADIVLLTESGYLMLVKSFTDDLAWEVQRQLVNSYFTVKKMRADKPSRKEKLPSVNQMVKNIKGALQDAGVDSKYIAAEVVRIYSDNGYPVKVPLISDVPVLWDCTTIAKELGICSESGRPHDKAVSAIIQKMYVSEDEMVKTAYSRNGHDGVTVQYKDSVLRKIKLWLKENGYPTVIEYQLSNGNINKCKVVYQEVA